MNTINAAAALVEALYASTGATPALRGLWLPRYPLRELHPQAQPDGSVVCRISKRGYGYKDHTPTPKTPPPADTAAIRAALNAALHPGLTITAAVDHGEYITITMEEKP